MDYGHVLFVFQLPVADVISPLQGFRVLLTNLHHIVSEDDLTVSWEPFR